MWIVSTIGFYSVVQNQRDEDSLLVRARVRQDLVNLIKTCDVPFKESDILSTPSADYPYRLIMPKVVFQVALATLGRMIDYSNFKHEVEVKQGRARAGAYLDVWSAIRQIELPRDGRKR